MPRPTPADKIARAALRRLERASRAIGNKATPWEKDFLVDVKKRIEQFGSAFADPEKGFLDQSLSISQSYKVSEIRQLAKIRRGIKGGRKSSFGRPSRSR